jgi:predicted nucleic acid-binding protein
VSLYLDAGAVMAVVAEEETNALVDPVIRNAGTLVLLSEFCLAECSAAISKLARMRIRSIGEADLLMDRLDRWAAALTNRTAIENADVTNAIGLVRRHELKLRAPDAIHIAATHRLGATLVTLDRGMARAATALGLPCINPADASAL